MTHDIVIVGGGMVGLALACMLARQTALSIAILEAKAHQPSPHRVSAIALSSQQLFQSLDVWNAISQQGVSAFRNIIVWDAIKKGEIHFDSREIAEAMLGHIIENDVIQSALKNKLKHYPQVDIIEPVTLISMKTYEDKIEFATDDERMIKAKLAIAADVANSWLRKQAGIEIEKLDYEQQAIVATVQTTLPHHETARQVFLPAGPLAFLPLLDAHTSSIVWSLPNEEAARLMNLHAEDFQRELAHVFEHRLGEVVTSSQRFAFPLARQKAASYIAHRIALVGDAAHTVHPLAGQGVNMGLQDAASLCDVIVNAISQQRNVAGLSTLRAYERWRKADNLAMYAGIDFIKNLFASDKTFIQHMRSSGLNAVNHTRWIKNIFTSHASGMRGVCNGQAK